MNAQPKADEPGRALGVAMIVILVVLLLTAWTMGMSIDRPAPAGTGPIFMGLFLVALGFMFLASYFAAWKSFFLRWLLKFSMGFPFLADRRMALFFFVLCLFVGIGAIADGLGLRFV
jgi:hypothetical protein